MELTADFIRALSGLSAAELPDKVIEDLKVIDIANDSASNYPELSETDELYYKGYKALTLLGPSLLLSVAKTIKDNFNIFSRFDNLADLLALASSKVAAVEDPEGYASYSLFEVVVPLIDPVIGDPR